MAVMEQADIQALLPHRYPFLLVDRVLELEPDRRLTRPLCPGEDCGRCLLACPGDAVRQWGLEKKACAPYASPHGFAHVVSHVGNVLRAENVEQKVELLRGGDSFNSFRNFTPNFFYE